MVFVLGENSKCLLVINLKEEKKSVLQDTDFNFFFFYMKQVGGSGPSSSVCFNEAVFTEQFFGVSSSSLQSYQDRPSGRWTAMKEDSVITAAETFPRAKTEDRGRLFTRYSMSTCGGKCAKAETKDLNFKNMHKSGNKSKKKWQDV